MIKIFAYISLVRQWHWKAFQSEWERLSNWQRDYRIYFEPINVQMNDIQSTIVGNVHLVVKWRWYDVSCSDLNGLYGCVKYSTLNRFNALRFTERKLKVNLSEMNVNSINSLGINYGTYQIRSIHQLLKSSGKFSKLITMQSHLNNMLINRWIFHRVQMMHLI